jgi:hypothetical protein
MTDYRGTSREVGRGKFLGRRRSRINNRGRIELPPYKAKTTQYARDKHK